MADFKDELHIKKVSELPLYDWCQSTTNLADNTVTIVAYGQDVSLGTACKVICDWGNASICGIKLNIRAFLETDRFDDSCEY